MVNCSERSLAVLFHVMVPFIYAAHLLCSQPAGMEEPTGG